MPWPSPAGEISTHGVRLARSVSRMTGLSHSGGVRIMPSGRSAASMDSICACTSVAVLLQRLDDQVAAGLAAAQRRALLHAGDERGARVVVQQADEEGPGAGQAARRQLRAVVQRGDGFLHAGPRVGVHRGLLVHHARDCLDRHAGPAGHVDDGGRCARSLVHCVASPDSFLSRRGLCRPGANSPCLRQSNVSSLEKLAGTMGFALPERQVSRQHWHRSSGFCRKRQNETRRYGAESMPAPR